MSSNLYHKRILVFLFGCIGIRLLLVLIAKYINIEYLPYMGVIALIISLNFIYLYFIGNNRVDRQLEWLGDKMIWWNQLRIVHAMLYILFAIYAIQKKPYAWIPLLVDCIFGLSAWLLHNKYNITFN